jgi:hypothetical protein
MAIMICDLSSAASSGNLDEGWLAHDLVVADSPAAHAAVELHVASSCLETRAVAELSRKSPRWVGDY